MNGTVQTFRGYRAIGEVVERMELLRAWYRVNQPTASSITLYRRDLDLLQRWPKAAAIHEIFTNDEKRTYWKGFELHADKGPGRYERTPPMYLEGRP